MLTPVAGFELLITCLLLPYAAWLLGTGLRRLAPLRVAEAVVVAFLGLLPLGDPSNKPPVQVLGTLILALPVIVLTGLLKRPPPRKAATVQPAVPAPLPPLTAQDLTLWDRPIATSTRLLLRYQDAGGTVTDREVRPTSLKGRGAVSVGTIRAIGGYCLMRKGPRVFRLDRIVHAADPETGEIIDLPAWLDEHMK